MAASSKRREQPRGLRILIVTHYAYPHSGGIEQATFNQARALVRAGNNVTIVSSNIPESQTEETVEGVKFVRVPASRILEQGSGVPYTVFSRALGKELYKLIPNCDVVHVHGSLYHSTWTAIRIAKRYKKPVVLTEHVGKVPYTNPILKGIQHAAYAVAGARALRSADRVIVLTDEVRAHVEALRGTSEGVKLIANGIDTTFFSPASSVTKNKIKAGLKVPKESSLIVFNGRLIEKKGFQYVLDALTDKDYAICIGSGAAPQKYLTQSNCWFVGTVSQAQVRDILRAADCFALPSVGEGFPVATMEALAVGVPCVLSNTQSNNHYVPKSAAIFVDCTAPSVQQGIANAKKRSGALSKAARLLATKTMSIERSAAQLQQIYHEVA